MVEEIDEEEDEEENAEEDDLFPKFLHDNLYVHKKTFFEISTIASFI